MYQDGNQDIVAMFNVPFLQFVKSSASNDSEVCFALSESLI